MGVSIAVGGRNCGSTLGKSSRRVIQFSETVPKDAAGAQRNPVHNHICPVSIFSLVLLNVTASPYVSTNINANINEHLLGTYARLWIATIGWLSAGDGKVSKHVLQQMNCLCPLTSRGRAFIFDHYLQIIRWVLFVWASSLKSIYKAYACFLWRTDTLPAYH